MVGAVRQAHEHYQSATDEQVEAAAYKVIVPAVLLAQEVVCVVRGVKGLPVVLLHGKVRQQAARLATLQCLRKWRQLNV